MAENNGGFNIGGGADTASIRDVIIEGNRVAMSDPDKAMQVSNGMLNRSTVVRGNDIT